MRTSSHYGGLIVLSITLAGVLLLVLPSASGQQPPQLQCPVAQLRILPNGTVVFDPLPAGADFVEPTVDTGPASGWYSLAAGFVDVVRPGSLPYNQIRTSLTETGVQCSIGNVSCGDDGRDGGQFDVQQTLTSFATWWIGILIVTLIGGIGAIAFAITGMCFCCCRCCGKCGGSKTQEIGDNMDCKTFSFTIVLLFLLAVLFAGVVLAFFSNQQTFDSVANANTSINNVISDGVQYIDDTITELEQIVCQLAGGQGVAVEVVDEARQFSGSLMTYVNDLEGEVERIYGNIDTLSPSFNTTIETLRNISTTTSALVASGNTLSNSLSIIQNNLVTVRMTCADNSLPCDSLPDPSVFQKGADFTEVPGVDEQLNDITNAINDINFDNLVDQGRQTFNDIRRSINDTVSGNVDETLNQVLQYNDTLFGFIDNITGTVREYIDDGPQNCEDLLTDFGNLQLNVGFFRQCIINAGFEQIEEFDVYRYAFGVVVCSLALVTIVVALLGVVMGMFGFRKNKDPEQRTKLSHCGGICLVLDVVLTFIFGFVLLVLCCIFFFFGSNAQKLCQSVEGPEYPLFTELIDNTSYWGGRSLLATQLFPDGDEEIFVSGVLNMCSEDAGVFQAANLSNLLPSGSISAEIDSVLNLNELRATINGSIANATRDFTFNETSFLPDDVQNSLEEIRNASVDQINITAFREQINAPLVMFNISEQIINLMILSSNLSTLAMMGSTEAMEAQMLVDNSTNELINIRDVQIPAIQGQVNSLESSVNGLETQIDGVISETVALVDTINSVIQNITGQSLPRFLNENVNGALNRVFTLLDQSIDHVDTEISMNVGACQPLYGIYLQLYNSVCEDFLQGLNGFWWSLGFCALLFIPIIVFLVLTSNYYLRKANAAEATAGYSSYDDYPMKSY